MDDSLFWAIIDRTAIHEADTGSADGALRRELEALTADEVVASTNTMQRQLARAWRWDLWAVGYIIEGGMSDDRFEYFRRWLRRKAGPFFDQVLAHPDDRCRPAALSCAAGRSGSDEGFRDHCSSCGRVRQNEACLRRDTGDRRDQTPAEPALARPVRRTGDAWLASALPEERVARVRPDRRGAPPPRSSPAWLGRRPASRIGMPASVGR